MDILNLIFNINWYYKWLEFTSIFFLNWSYKNIVNLWACLVSRLRAFDISAMLIDARRNKIKDKLSIWRVLRLKSLARPLIV